LLFQCAAAATAFELQFAASAACAVARRPCLLLRLLHRHSAMLEMQLVMLAGPFGAAFRSGS
jgi:hypothetical protein